MTIKIKQLPSSETVNPHKTSFAKQIANTTLKSWTKQVAYKNLTNQLQKEFHWPITKIWAFLLTKNLCKLQTDKLINLLCPCSTLQTDKKNTFTTNAKFIWNNYKKIICANANQKSDIHCWSIKMDSGKENFSEWKLINSKIKFLILKSIL